MSGFPDAFAAQWFPVATTAELKRRPLARSLLGTPLAVFRGADGPAVLVDRCPHRNLALSRGRLRGGEVECPYHGWRFAADGRCTLTPGAEAPARARAHALPVRVRDGLVWTSLAARPKGEPAPPAPVGEAGFDSFLWPVAPARAHWADAVENLLDPAHPHFLHAGLVRAADLRQPVEVTVRTFADRAEAVYLENGRATALIPRLLEGFRTTSIGRVFGPSTGQIAFEGPDGLRLAITVFFTPEAEDRVRPFAHFATPRRRAPAWLKALALRAAHRPILAQDRAMLELQAEDLARFGAPNYALGPLDVLRPAIDALAAGEPLTVGERTFTARL